MVITIDDSSVSHHIMPNKLVDASKVFMLASQKPKVSRLYQLESAPQQKKSPPTKSRWVYKDYSQKEVYEKLLAEEHPWKSHSLAGVGGTNEFS